MPDKTLGLFGHFAKQKDDYNRSCATIKRLPYAGGNILVGIVSYEQIARERKAEGIDCPLWENLDVIYEKGKWADDT